MVRSHRSQEVLHDGGKIFFATFHTDLSRWELHMIHRYQRASSLVKRESHIIEDPEKSWKFSFNSLVTGTSEILGMFQ